MPRRAFILTACLLSCVATLAVAQAPVPALEPSKVNATRLRWLQYRLVAGRVVASSSYPAGMNISFGPSVIDGRFREHLQLLILKDQASVHYELSGDGDELAIELAEDGVFSIRRRQQKTALAAEYLQPQGQPVTFTVTSGGQERVYVAESFWHLYLAAPELVRTELIPYLEILRPSWQLAATGAAIEDALIQHAQHPQEVDTQRWRELVAQLGSETFSEREASERELFRVGQLILPFLEELDPLRLDAEQADRVSKLVKALSVDYEDATDRVANWLAGDRDAWLSLLDRPDEAKRRLAARQVELLVDSPIAFDPEADDATRASQLEQLRRRLGVPASVPAPPARD